MNIHIELLWGCSCCAKPLQICVWACILFLTPWCFVDSTPTNSAPGSSPSSPIGASSALGAENGPSSLPTTTKTEVCVSDDGANHQHCYWFAPKKWNKSLFALAILHAFEYQHYNFMSGSQMPVCPVCSYKNSQFVFSSEWLSALTLNRHSLTHMCDYLKFVCYKEGILCRMIYWLDHCSNSEHKYCKNNSKNVSIQHFSSRCAVQ